MGERNKITKSAFFNGNFYAKLVINILKIVFQTNEQTYTKTKTLTRQYFLVNNIIWDHKFFSYFYFCFYFSLCFTLQLNCITMFFQYDVFWCFVCLFFFFITFSISIFSKEILTYLWWTWQWQVHGLQSKSKNIYKEEKKK